MARVPRRLIIFPNHSVHKVWRGHNKEANLRTNEQKFKYLQYLNEDLESKRFDPGSQLQALTLMDNHAHEDSGVRDQTLYSNHMRRHHARYGQYFNRTNNRSGKVAEGRPHTTLISGDRHAQDTVHYIHANPLRAKIVRNAKDYYWSTYRLYAFGRREPWMRNVKFPEWYLRLGRTAEQRQKAYRQSFERYLRRLAGRRINLSRKRFFGNAEWVKECEQAVKRWRAEHKPPP